MKAILKVLVVFLLLVSSSGMALAQNSPKNPQACPAKNCTVFLWMNGVFGGTGITAENNWQVQVSGTTNSFKSTYFAVHNPPFNPNSNLVVFDYVFNHGGIDPNLLATIATAPGDLYQSKVQIKMLLNHQVDLTDPDYVALLNAIQAYSSQGYKVVLVGHSQGTLYMDLAYQGIKDKVVGNYVPSITSLPDNTKLEIVNIATPYNAVVDGNGMYTTQCGDVIYLPVLLGNLPPNISNNGVGCPYVADFSGSVALHDLANSYLAPGSQTQIQIYADLDLALGLPDPGCNGDANCFLKDSFMGDYITNWRQVGDMALLQTGSTIDTASHLGTLQLTSYNNYNTVVTGSGVATTPARLSVRSRRVFSGSVHDELEIQLLGNNRIKLARTG